MAGWGWVLGSRDRRDRGVAGRRDVDLRDLTRRVSDVGGVAVAVSAKLRVFTPQGLCF